MIDLLHARPSAVRLVESLIEARETLCVTPHVFYELYRGVRRAADPASHGRMVARLGERFRLLPFDRDAALLAARMAGSLEEEGRDIPEIDLFIAASAVVWGDGVVLTRDIGHFRRLKRFGVRAVVA